VDSPPAISVVAPSAPEPAPNIAAGERVNVLLMGTDCRLVDKGVCRTDTMILATLDPTTATAGAVTIPRDLWVPIPGVGESRIKKYVFQPSGRIVWIVVGKERDYLVMPAGSYCSCDDFYYQFDHGHLCYHIIAQKLAEALGRFDLFEDDDDFFDILIKEWKQPEEHPPSKRKKAASSEGTV
jgi:predicted nucleic acid-binding Zn finger protein